MKPIYTKILEGATVSGFSTKNIIRPSFSTEFHFHQECQMTYIVQSEGKRIIGDNVDSFSADELTFIGPDLPHVWHNDERNQQLSSQAQSMAIYLDATVLIDSFQSLFPPHKFISFINASKRGLLFWGKTKKRLIHLLRKIVVQDEDIKKALILIEIVDILSHTNEYTYLSSAGYTHNYKGIDNEKIDKIFKYVFDNFDKEILLSEIADMANMSKHTFCRFFKSRTKKTLFQFVNEVRISESCKLIAADKLQINHIAYECGFNSLSNFNRTFKSIKKITPTAYKVRLFG